MKLHLQNNRQLSLDHMYWLKMFDISLSISNAVAILMLIQFVGDGVNNMDIEYEFRLQLQLSSQQQLVVNDRIVEQLTNIGISF